MNFSDLIDPSFSYRLIATLLHFLWQGCLVVLLAVLGDGLLSRVSASRRYALHVAAMAVMVVCVAITFSRVESPASIPVVSVNSPAMTTITGPMTPERVDDDSASMPTAVMPPFVGAESTQQEPLPVVAVEPAVSPIVGQERPAASNDRWRQLQAWAPQIALLYFACCGLLLARLMRGTWIAHRLRKMATIVDDDSLIATLQRQSHELGLRVLPRIAWCAEVSIPLVIGVVKPMILLPTAAATGLSPDQLQALITHELAHIRRYDLLVNLVQRVVESMLFFHPAVWFISRRISNEREQACDELVLATGCERLRYADALVRMAELSSSLRRVGASAPATSLAASGANSSEFKRRVLKVLSVPTTSHMRPSRIALLTIVVLMIGVTISASRLRDNVFAGTLPKSVDDSSTSEREPGDLHRAQSQTETRDADAKSKSFRLKIVGPDGKPVAKAKVEFRGRPEVSAEQFQRGVFVEKHKYGASVTADENGEVVVDRPREEKSFQVFVEQPGFGPYWVEWDGEVNPKLELPEEFTAQLDAAWSVGGIVVDESGEPIADARVRPSIEYKKPPGDRKQLGVGAEIRTDANGAWRYDLVPVTKKNEDYVHVSVDHPNFQPLRRPLKRAEFEIKPNDKPAARIEMKRGVIVTGKVTDSAGKPVENALVRSKFINEVREARTDASGEYRLGGCEPIEARIVVSAKGLAVEMQEVRVEAGMKPVDFSLKPGGHVRVRVVDEAGRGIPKARIFFQQWRGRFQYFEFNHRGQYTDENGVWEWDEAPLDEFQADICHPDGMQLPSQLLLARAEEYVFKPAPALIVSGRVVDAKTKQPIAKFRVTPGERVEWDTNRHWNSRDGFDAKNGQYQVRFDSSRPAFLVRIEAPGYRATISRDIKPDEGKIDIPFDLQPAEDVSATVRTPSGEPAAGARIALGVAGSQISIRNGEFRDGSTYATRLETDANGTFRLSARDEAFQLVILHPSGFAHLMSADGLVPKDVKLTAWARVEGTLRSSTSPSRANDSATAKSVDDSKTARLGESGYVAEVTLLLSSNDAIHSHGKDGPSIYCEQQTTTNEAGRYVFERVFPGRGKLGREVSLKTGPTSSTSSSSHQVEVELVPGKTTELNLGGKGRAVIGQLAAPDGAAEPIRWNMAQAELNSDLLEPPLPVNMIGAANDPVRKPQWDKWLKSAAGRTWNTAFNAYLTEREKSSRFLANVAEDGSFRIDDVPAGMYVLTIGFHGEAPGNLPARHLTVPDAGEELLNLGVLKFLKPFPKLQGLSPDMTEPQFLEIVKQQKLKTRKTVEGEEVMYHLALDDGHSLIVMFDKDAKCVGIQRVRDEVLSGRLFVNAGVRTAKDETRISQSVIAIDPATGKWTPLQSLNKSGLTVPLSPVRVSPDGRTMLFMKKKELWKCDASTGEGAVRVLEQGSPAAWSPDGKTLIAVVPTSERDPQAIENWLVSIDGQKQSVLPLQKGDEVEDWSADGQWLAVKSRVSGEVLVVKPDGSERRKLADSEGGYSMGRISFAPDGKRVVYLSQHEVDEKHSHSLRIINVDGTGDRELLGETKAGSKPDSETWTAPMSARWSPDGKQLAVVLFDHGQDGGITAIGGNWRLAFIDPDGSNLRELKLDGVLTTVLPWDGPEWSNIPPPAAPVVPAGEAATSQREPPLTDVELLKLVCRPGTSLHALSLGMSELRFRAMMCECRIPMQTMRGDGRKVSYTIATGYDRDVLVKFDNEKCETIQPIPRAAWPNKASFESLTVAFKNSHGGRPPEQIVIKGNGECFYRVDEVPARGTIAKRSGAVINSKVHPERMLELERLLAETEWLTKKPDEPKGPPQLHTDETPITVVRGGVTTTVKCVAPRDDLYRTLLWLLRGTAKQEQFIYAIDWNPDDASSRNLALHEIRMGIEALQGQPGRALPQFDYDYHRLLTTFGRMLRNPNEQEEPLITAIKVASITREDSEFDAIARWRNDRSSNVRNAVAIAITESAMGGAEGSRQLALLPEMVSSSEEARWGLIRFGDFGIPTIVKLIEPGRTESDIVSEQMVRAFLDHRKELTGPLDARLIAAVRLGLAATKARSQRTEYYEEFLKWAEQQPIKAAPADPVQALEIGLEFLKPYPQLHGLSLGMTERQFLEIVQQQELKTRKRGEGDKTAYWIGLGDGLTLIVMFHADRTCRGIQRIRGEDNSIGAVGHFSGRVLGPDGKPVRQARVFLVPFDAKQQSIGPVRAETDAEGRFEFDAPDMTYLDADGRAARRQGMLMASAEGYAADWLRTWGHNHGGLKSHFDPVEGAALELRLAKDDVLIQGRFLNHDGQPLVGASVKVEAIRIPRGHDLDASLKRQSQQFAEFLSPDFERELYRERVKWLPGIVSETRTDAEGRFKLSGCGRDRLVTLNISAPSVVDTAVTVMTREVADAVVKHDGAGAPTPNGATLHGAKFSQQLLPGRTIKGRVIDRETRQPVAGMWVGPRQNAIVTVTRDLYPWITDSEGRFTIFGLSPSNAQEEIAAIATPGVPYSSASVFADGKTDIVIETSRGIPFRLKLVDEQNRPVDAEVTYSDIHPNPHIAKQRDEFHWPVNRAARKANGIYEGFALPGPGAVLVTLPHESKFRPARVDPKAFFAPGKTNWTAEELATSYGNADELVISQGVYRDTLYRSDRLSQKDYAAIVLVNPPKNSGTLELSAVVALNPTRVAMNPTSNLTSTRAEAEPRDEKGLRVDVPNGVRLELVGLSAIHTGNREADQRRWWDARGESIGTTDKLFDEKRRMRGMSEYSKGLEAIVRLTVHRDSPFVEALRKRAAWIEGEVDGVSSTPAVFIAGQTPPLLFHLKSNGPTEDRERLDIQLHTHFVPAADAKTTRLRFGFGHEATSQTYDDKGKLNHETAVKEHPEIWRRFALLRIESRPEGVVVWTKPTRGLGDLGRGWVRLLLVDGTVLNSTAPRLSDNGDEEQHLFSKINAEDVDGVTLSVHPVTHWVSFNGLPLSAEPTSDAKVEVQTVAHGNLEFLKPYPKLHGLSLDMTEPQFLEVVKQQELKTRKSVSQEKGEGEKVTHHIALGDGHALIVMFDKDAKCSGIQRVRGEDAVDETVSLADAVRVFNAENKRLGRGLDQPALTEEEVIAVINRDKWERGGPWSLNENEVVAFKAVAESKRLPQGARLDVHTEDRAATFHLKQVWQVRLMLPAVGHDGLVGLTIRNTKIADEKINPKLIAWGKPDAKGLALGAYLSPRKAQYAFGERVRLRLFVRNDGQQPVNGLTFYRTSHPMPDDFTVTDDKGAKVAVRLGHEDWVLPWVSGATSGGLASGETHAFSIPYEILIGGDGSQNELIGRVIDARPGQKLQLKVREHNGNDRNHQQGEPEPESDSISFTVAEGPFDPTAALPNSDEETNPPNNAN